MFARRIVSWSLAGVTLCWGCSADKQLLPLDASVSSDSGAGSGDGGMRVDSGARDAGATGSDAGSPGVDAGSPGVDAGSPGVDAGSPGVDAGPGGADAGAGGTDAGAAGPDAGPGARDAGFSRRDASVDCSGIECAGFPATFIRGCTNDDSCVGEVHRTDCCGATRVLGMNHSEATAFCAAEAACRASYPAPGLCTDTEVVTDTGSTPSLTNVAARCFDIDPSSGVGTCRTFVCGVAGGMPCPAVRRIGLCAIVVQ